MTAVELLRTGGPRVAAGRIGAHVRSFYVILAPFVGAFADAPKGRVMFVSNAIKVVGCLMMLFGSHPLMAMPWWGWAPPPYSPGQVRHPDRTAACLATGQANGWIEG